MSIAAFGRRSGSRPQGRASPARVGTLYPVLQPGPRSTPPARLDLPVPGCRARRPAPGVYRAVQSSLRMRTKGRPMEPSDRVETVVESTAGTREGGPDARTGTDRAGEPDWQRMERTQDAVVFQTPASLSFLPGRSTRRRRRGGAYRRGRRGSVHRTRQETRWSWADASRPALSPAASTRARPAARRSPRGSVSSTRPSRPAVSGGPRAAWSSAATTAGAVAAGRRPGGGREGTSRLKKLGERVGGPAYLEVRRRALGLTGDDETPGPT